MENKDEEIRKLFKFFEQDKMNQLHRIYLMQLLKEKFMNEILHSACFVNDNAVLDCSSRCKSRKNVDNFAKFVDFLRSTKELLVMILTKNTIQFQMLIR